MGTLRVTPVLRFRFKSNRHQYNFFFTVLMFEIDEDNVCLHLPYTNSRKCFFYIYPGFCRFNWSGPPGINQSTYLTFWYIYSTPSVITDFLKSFRNPTVKCVIGNLVIFLALFSGPIRIESLIKLFWILNRFTRQKCCPVFKKKNIPYSL
jgi:hypothetical protein